MKVNERKTPLVPVTLHKTNTGYTVRAEGKTYRLHSSMEEFSKFLDHFQFYTDEKPVTKTENDYGSIVKKLEDGEKQKLFLYQNRAQKLYAYLRKNGNPYNKPKKESVSSILDAESVEDIHQFIEAKKTKWEISILAKGPKHIKKTIELGPQADKDDVKNQIKRMGIEGEILSITKVE